MGGTVKGTYIDSDLRDDRCRDHPINTWNLYQATQFAVIGREPLTQSLVQLLKVGLSGGDALQMQAQHEAVILVNMAVPCPRQFGFFTPHAAPRPPRHLLRRMFPFDQRSPPRPAP